MIDFNELEKHKDEITGDDCFFAIGNQKITPQKDYIDVELNLPVKIVRLLKIITKIFYICFIWRS